MSGRLLLLLPMRPSTDDGKHVDNVFGSECHPAGMPPLDIRYKLQSLPDLWTRRPDHVGSLASHPAQPERNGGDGCGYAVGRLGCTWSHQVPWTQHGTWQGWQSRDGTGKRSVVRAYGKNAPGSADWQW